MPDITELGQLRADQACAFVNALKHTKGNFFGKPFDLLDWQRDFIREVYGTLNPSGYRKYQYAYLEIPKKNGKSELGAALALKHTFADGEQYGEIYSCAADRAQASFVFDVAVAMIDQSPALKKRAKLKISQKQIHDKISHSVYTAVSAEAYSKHGMNVSACIFDELHAQPNRDLWDVMTTYAGDARKQPLWYVITTAGDDADRKSIGWEVHEKARKLISGEIQDPRWYCKIWGVEPNFTGDIYDEALWYRVNPSLGYTIDIEKVRQAAIAAKNSPAEERLFRWLRLNQWISVKRTGWLPITLWDDTTAKGWTRESLRGKKCYVGLDLSSTGDLTAATSLFPPENSGEPWRYFMDMWIPEDNMAEREKNDHVPFRDWYQNGYIHATPGNCIDYAEIAAYLERLSHDYDVRYFSADKWRIDNLSSLMDTSIDAEIITIPQTIEGMSPAMKELERMMYAGEIEHEKNPCGRWTFGNVVVAVDGNENMKPHKGRSMDRIDPVVALINAMAAAIRLENKKSVYEERGMRML